MFSKETLTVIEILLIALPMVWATGVAVSNIIESDSNPRPVTISPLKDLVIGAVTIIGLVIALLLGLFVYALIGAVIFLIVFPLIVIGLPILGLTLFVLHILNS